MLDVPTTMSQTSLLHRLAETQRQASPWGEFFQADLRGADLSGMRLASISLAAARLDGADLTGAQFSHVDLTNASLEGACLDRTRFEMVSAGSARLIGARVRDAFWEQVNLTGADLSRADLSRTTLRGARLESARLDDAVLTGGSLVYCYCEGASFRDSLLDLFNTIGSSFGGTDLTGARRFFLSRELVVEMLRREMGSDVELIKLIGAASVNPRWCYPEWKRILESDPEHRQAILNIFAHSPASGCFEALRDGWKPARPNLP